MSGRAAWRCGRCDRVQDGDVAPIFVPIAKDAHDAVDGGGAWTTIGICPSCERKENGE